MAVVEWKYRNLPYIPDNPERQKVLELYAENLGKLARPAANLDDINGKLDTLIKIMTDNNTRKED